MRMKWLYLFGILGLAVASAKTYDVSMSAPATVGTVQLAPGDYRLAVNGSKAVFTSIKDSHKTFETNVKVENADKKFPFTAIESRKVEGRNHVDNIELGGTKLKLEFN